MTYNVLVGTLNPTHSLTHSSSGLSTCNMAWYEGWCWSWSQSPCSQPTGDASDKPSSRLPFLSSG